MGSLKTPRLLTDRLILRPPTRWDRRFLSRLVSDPEVRRYLGGAVPQADLRRYVDQIFRASSGSHVWLVIRWPGLFPLGVVYLEPQKDGAALELSYQFARRAWGKGYASEAVQCVTTYAFKSLGQSRLVAETQCANTASCLMLTRLGWAEARRLTRFGAEQILFEKSPP